MSHPIPTQNYPCENCGGDIEECGCGNDPYKKLFEEFDEEFPILADMPDGVPSNVKPELKDFIRKHTIPKSEIEKKRRKGKFHPDSLAGIEQTTINNLLDDLLNK